MNNKCTLVAIIIFCVIKVSMVMNDVAQVDKSNARMLEYRQQMNQAYAGVNK